MKLKRLILALTLAGASLQQSSAQDYPKPMAGSSLGRSAGATAARHIGDGVQSLGDSSRYVEIGEDLRPQAFRTSGRLVSNEGAVNQSYVNQSTVNESTVTPMDMSMLAPTTADYSPGCGPSCDAGCSSLGSSWRGMRSSWFEAESLLWFGQERSSPPLVTTAAQGVLPVAGAPGVTSELGGGDGISSGLLPGFRLSFGTYLGDCEKVGIGGRVYGIFPSRENYSNASNGSTSIGIPFYNLQSGQPDAYLVAFSTANAPVASGSINANSDLDMIGAEANGRFLLARSCDHRVDMLAGYTFNRLQDSIEIGSTSTDLFTGNLIPDGTTFQTLDLFDADNVFHGAHLGMLSSVVRNRLTLSSLAKISFGNMRQSGRIDGFTIQTLPNANPTTSAGGVLTQPSNMGAFERDTFAFIPELGAKLGYQVRCNLQLTVGYTFMYWSNVALAGRQIDSTVDFSQSLGGPAGNRPAFQFQESSFWMQGIDLGMTYAF